MILGLQKNIEKKPTHNPTEQVYSLAKIRANQLFPRLLVFTHQVVEGNNGFDLLDDEIREKMMQLPTSIRSKTISLMLDLVVEEITRIESTQVEITSITATILRSKKMAVHVTTPIDQIRDRYPHLYDVTQVIEALHKDYALGSSEIEIVKKLEAALLRFQNQLT